MSKTIRVLAFTGSLRKDSFNKALIHCAMEECPDNVTIDVFDLANIPLFNEDLIKTLPDKVREFKQKIREVDALLMAVPEYNYSVSGVLKNALDWASRPKEGNPLQGKPVAIMSASTGRFGGARGQMHLCLARKLIYNLHPLAPYCMVNICVRGCMGYPSNRRLTYPWPIQSRHQRTNEPPRHSQICPN